MGCQQFGYTVCWHYAQRFAANRSGCLNKTSIYKQMLVQPFLLGAVISCKNYDYEIYRLLEAKQRII